MVGKFHPQPYDLQEKIGMIYTICMEERDLARASDGREEVSPLGLGGQLSVLVNFINLR